jgi:hypothetical protein
MKTKLIILTLAIVSCILTTTTVFAQTIYTWTGAGDETNIANAALRAVRPTAIRKTPANGTASRRGI